MKVGKDGKLKLSKDEKQFGNFIIKNEAEFIKISDLNGHFTHRISKNLNMGQMISIALQTKQTLWLEHYAALVWLFSNVVADEQFFLDVSKVCDDCINRNMSLYGINENISEEEDKTILDSTQAFEEEFNKVFEDKEKREQKRKKK